ncbi:sensor histidine kinase [Rhodocista pekingensis]|uniref:histidine kinase n=1 Tax=Rhodocista pekingensis TaxID=201185 RepID=A0ABW2KSL2_9PROT
MLRTSWLQTAPREVALRVTAIYVVVGALWIVGSDYAAGTLLAHAVAPDLVQTVKGLLFIAVSAGFLFLAVRHWVGQIADRSSASLAETIRAEHAQERARLEAEALARAKSQFMASISHELRTPLNAVIGFAELMETMAGQMTPEQIRDYAAEIGVGGRGLLALVQDITAVAEADAGQAMRMESVNLLEEVERTLRLAVSRHTAERRPVTVHIDPETVLRTDGTALRQILFALMDNAIRHTPVGTAVTVSAVPTPGGVMLVVEDTGPGLPTEVLARLGEPFLRGGDPLIAGRGLGLGLYLVCRLSRQLGGGLQGGNRPDGGGARLTVVLPDGPAGTLLSPPPPAIPPNL